VAVTAATLWAAPALAQQRVSVYGGYFAVKGEDGRTTDDVLVENLNTLLFEIDDFNGGTVGAEWLVGIGDYVEAGVGIGFYRRTVPSIYAGFTDIDGTEIEQDLRLRIVPITASVRFFPLGHFNAFQPYVGAGVGVFNWRYSETGEFVDFSDLTIFRDSFVADGTEIGPIVMAGARFSPGGAFSVGGEFRYQSAEGTVGVENGFLADKIDLGGYAALATFTVRF
jgi:hypothetical protein